VSDTFLAEAAALREFSAAVAEAMGAPPDVAGEVARHLARANLSGHDSHGVLRWSQYVRELDLGQLDPAARPALLRESTVTALFDARRGFGQHSTMRAAEWAAAHAREHGIAAAAIRHSMHIGRLGEYTGRLAGEGLVGIVTVGVAGDGSGTSIVMRSPALTARSALAARPATATCPCSMSRCIWDRDWPGTTAER